MPLANTKLVVRNHAALGSVLLTHPGTMLDDPTNPLTNLTNPDRSVRYYNAGSSGFVLIDLGAAVRTTNAVGFLGLKHASGGLNPTPFYVRSYNTYPNPVIAACSTVNATQTLSRATAFPSTVKVGQFVVLTSPLVGGCSATGTNVLTRAAFDFAAAGVFVGQTVVLSGGGITVPANTTVTVVAVGSVTMSNVASGTGTVTAQFGPFVPALTTVTAIAAGRLSLTMSANATGTQSGTVTATFNDYKDVTNGGTNIPVGDFVLELATPITARYIEFEFPAVFQPFSLSCFVAAQVLDMGIVYTPGSTDAIVRQFVENQTVEGTTTLTRTGPDRQRFRTMFANITQAQRDALFALAAPADARLSSLVLLHPQAPFTSIVECRLVGNEIEATHVFGPPDLYSVTLTLETMP